MELSGWQRALVNGRAMERRTRQKQRWAELVEANPQLSLQEMFSKRVRPEVRALIDDALARRQSPA